jgi:cytochrome c nitrite reductase small subunit
MQFLRKLAIALRPPPGWQLPVTIALGIFVGLGALTFHVSRASSYLSDDPRTCVNCHVMAPQYATWAHSAHREFASCNDCHVPHDNIIRHYFFKAQDGFRHSTIFTLRREPQVIRIHAAGQRVVQENCVRCHEPLIHKVQLDRVPGDDVHHEVGMRCWDCHRETPHGRVNSLASVPYEQVPLPGPATPGWLRELVRQSDAETPRRESP